MKKLTAVLLSIIMVLSLVSGVSYATDESISVTVRFDASVVAADMDTLYSDLVASGIIDGEVTNLPSDITVTVPKGSSVKEVLQAAQEESYFTVVGYDDNYITQVGYVGRDILENLVSTSVGYYPSGNIFNSAGWSFYIDGEGLTSSIDSVAVNTDGAVLEGRFRLAVGWDSNWNALYYDEIFLDNYHKLKELTEKNIDTSTFSEEQKRKYETEKAEGSALLSDIYNEACLNDEVSALLKEAHPTFTTSGGMWIGYIEKKDVSFWGTGSPTEKLENAVKELEAAINPIPENLLSELYVTTLFGTAEDNLIVDFSSDKTSYVIKNFTKDNFLPKFMKFKSVATSEDATVSVLLNGESIEASELSDNWKQYSSLGWDNNACNILTFTVTPPEGSSLSETVYTVKIYSEDELVVVPPMTKEERDAKIASLLENIAGAYTEKSSHWEVMDMGAYKKYAPETEANLSENAMKAFVNMSVSDVSESDTDTALAKAILALTAQGKDARRLYTVNSNTSIDATKKLDNTEHSTSVWYAPYTLAAYNRDEFGNRERELVLVNALLESQGDNGEWDEYGTIDSTANAIAGLAFYMDDEEVKTKVNEAIEKALEYLSTQQNDNGSFSDSWSGANSNSTAMVAIALAAAGVDVENDARFIKDGNSIIDGLLGFALPDNSGFGHTNNTAVSDNSTEQAFRALIALAGAIKNGSAYNVYDFNGIELSPARATDEYTGENGPSEPQGNQISVSLSIKADDGYWLRAYTVTLPGDGATVYHAFIKACQENGFTQTGADKGYVTSISNGKKTLSEFGEGKNSGWLYRLNGTAPLLGIRECEIKGGDSIQFFYTKDYTKEPGIGNWKDDEEEEEQIKEEMPEEEANDRKFSDVAESHWAKTYIYDLAERGILNGRGSGFAPEDNITRAEFVAILSRICEEEAVKSEASFADVSKDAWYAENVSWAVENGITNGISKSEFAPNANITREDMAVMLMRYIALKKISLKAKNAEVEFNDAEEIASYAYDAVKTMQKAGIISGMGASVFAPKNFATRAQAAKMISMILSAMEKEENTDDNEEIPELVSLLAKNVSENCKNPTVSSVGGEWAVIGLSRSGRCEDDEIFSSYLENLKKVLTENGGILHKRKYTEYARVILALSSLGENPDDFSGYDLVSPLGDFEKVTAQGINGAVWALIALDSKGYMDDAEIREKYVDEILSKSLADGGWSLSGDAPAEADITAMALIALAPYREKKEVLKASKKALSVLSALQSESGAFLSDGKETCESTAQVLVSLCTLGIPTDDERFVKNGKTVTDALLAFHLGDGSFCHTLDDKKPSAMSGEQAFYALVALERSIYGKSALFDMK